MPGNKPLPRLGNDLVDLKEARPLRKEHDERFLDRVFTNEERFCIARATDSALALWMIWAVKESLFKIASRAEPSTFFAHQLFPCPALEKIARAENGHLRAEVNGLCFDWRWDEELVHCVVGDSSWESKIAPAEQASTRALALEILSVPGARIERLPGVPRPQAPTAWLGETLLPATVSLSHDGRFAAAAVAR